MRAYVDLVRASFPAFAKAPYLIGVPKTATTGENGGGGGGGEGSKKDD